MVKKGHFYNRHQKFNHWLRFGDLYGLLTRLVETRQLLHAEFMRYRGDYQSRDSRTAKKDYRWKIDYKRGKISVT